jgi:group II intron reverse transcriptase/maturase
MVTKLMEKILSKENLEQARKAVIANKGSAGVDRMTVNELTKFIEEHGEEITERIKMRKYKPLPVKRVQIPKPDGTKRNLGIPSVKDRWLQQAVYQVLNPMFEEVFSNSSYGFRPGRRCEDAIVKALEYMNDGNDWLVDMDLSKFFDNVNQDILMILVHKVIKDPDTESLIRKFLQSGVLVEGTFEETRIGTPQGGNLSPLLANIYLNEFDKELESRGLRFTRYADDCVIYVRSEAAAKRVMKSVTRWLEEKLRVQVNVTKTKVCRPNGTKYLGFSFYNRNGKWRPKPHLKSVQKFKEKLHGYSKRSWSVSMDYRISKLNPVIRGWINYFRICDMKTLMKKMDRWLRVRIRMCIWKQWKTPRNREKALVKLGFPRWGAHRYANSRKGCMAIAMSRIMTRAVPKRILDLKGLLSLTDHYQLVHSY